LGKWQRRAGRRYTGAAIKISRGKRAYEIGGEAAETKLAERKIEQRTGMGGKVKIKLLQEEYANVTDPKNSTTKKAKITQVLKNSASVDYQRRGIVSKGAVIKTELGEAVVTSRPGQDGLINALLVKKK
jgi:small subunit ribosomal protein S8e